MSNSLIHEESALKSPASSGVGIREQVSSGGRSSVRWLAYLLLAHLLAVGGLCAESYEVPLAESDFKQLETGEASDLAKADRTFSKGEYRSAIAEYDLFLVTYPKSAATAYVLIRKGRSQMLDNKRNEAIMTFREVIDYFPDSVVCAAAALYYQAACYFANGERMNAVKAWKAMVKDPEYAKQPLAAPALVSLADELVRQKKHSEAVEFYEQVALEFRNRALEVAKAAVPKAYYIHVHVLPNEKKVRSFYLRLPRPNNAPAGSASDDSGKDDAVYWAAVRGMVHEWAGFPEEEKSDREAYFKYWADTMDGKFLKDNDFRIDLAWFRLQHEGKTEAWIERLQKQFDSTYKPGNHAQVVRFIRAFTAVSSKETKAKVEEYWAKLNFSEMDNALICDLINIMLGFGMRDAALSACNKINHAKWADEDRVKFLTVAEKFGEDFVLSIIRRFRDVEWGDFCLLKYYCSDAAPRDSAERGLAVADRVVKVARFASDGYWMQAGLFSGIRKYNEAIGAYLNSNKQPESLFRISDCYVALRNKEEAVGQLTEIENFFKPVASRAALQIANVYFGFGDDKQGIAALRAVMKKYPGSRESNPAHIELERRGVKMSGGTDAD